jgi:drug/metabolite transporter (DMT)-like permease
MLVQTMFAREVSGGNVTAFFFLSFLIPSLLLLAILGALRVRAPDKCEEKLQGRLVVMAALLAGALFVVNQLATTAATKISPVILFTFINGGNTVIATAIGAIMFGERLTARSTAGILLGIGGVWLYEETKDEVEEIGEKTEEVGDRITSWGKDVGKSTKKLFK